MLSRGRNKKQAPSLDTPGSISGQINMSLGERISVLTGIKPKVLKMGGLMLVVLVIAAAGGFLIKYQLDQNKTVISIGNYKIDQKTYNRLLGEAAAVNQNKSVARGEIIDGLATRAAADKLKIEYPTDDASISQAATQKFKAGKPSEYQKIAAYPEVIDMGVQLQSVGGYRFALLDFSFSRYIVGFNRTDFGDPKLIHNREEIVKDKEYAKQQMDQYMTFLKNKAKTIDQVVSEVKSNRRLINGQYGNQSDVVTVNLVGTRLSTEAPLNVGSELLAQVKQAAGQKNEPLIAEQLFTISPAEYGLGGMADITRPNGTLVGWRVIVVTDNFDKNPTIKTDYEKSRKEYQKDAKI